MPEPVVLVKPSCQLAVSASLHILAWLMSLGHIFGVVLLCSEVYCLIRSMLNFGMEGLYTMLLRLGPVLML
jgi:hypothetical protein